MLLKRPIAININFDSFNQNFGFPKNFKDPSFFKVFDRFAKFASEYNLKFSIYIIGKDLENPEIFARVKEWSEAGHEIGNHSYSHIQNLGFLSYAKIEKEILKSHELIIKCTSQQPKGFICPGWATSTKIVSILIKNNYLYDTSVFPSMLTYPLVFKNILNHLKTPGRLKGLIFRKDYLYPFTKPVVPFLSDKNYNKTSLLTKEKIVVLPLPTLNRFTISMWHTLWFVFGESYMRMEFKKYLNRYEYFYYLMHPTDLADKNDIDNRLCTIERIGISLSTKQKYMREVFELIRKSQRPIVTVEKLAKIFLEEVKHKESEKVISPTRR